MKNNWPCQNLSCEVLFYCHASIYNSNICFICLHFVFNFNIQDWEVDLDKIVIICILYTNTYYV